MHEMGIALRIIEIATDSLPADVKNPRVKLINLKIGKLAAAVPAGLRFSFEVAAKDTPFSGAELNFEEIPAVVRCRQCNTQWSSDGPNFTCKTCQKDTVDVISGREIEITSLEVL